MNTRQQHVVPSRTVPATNDAWVLRHRPSGGDGPQWSLVASPGTASRAIARGCEAVVAGNIYELDDLARHAGLVQRPDTPSNSDDAPARILLHGYLGDGVAFLKSVRGRFAFLLYDAAQDRLIAARDQMGLYPLFHTALPGGGWIFSNSIDALLAEPHVSRDLNRAVLAEHLTQRWVDSTETCFAAIRRIPPGHMLDATGRQHALRRYWNPRDCPAVSEDAAYARFDEVFDRAVRRCVGAGRAAIFLSGGFDSVSVAAAATADARSEGRCPPHALSLKFEDPSCDEELVQRGVAHRLGLSHDVVPFSQALEHRDLVAPALEMTATWPSPLLNVWTPGYDHLARRGVRQGCDVILTGTGGDEWLNVTPYVCADLLRRGHLRQLVRLMGVFRRSFRFTTPQVLRASLWTFGLRPLGSEALDTIAPIPWRARRTRKVIRSTHPWVAPDPALRKELDDRAERTLVLASPGPGGFYDRELQRSLDHPLVCLEHEEHFEFGRRVGAAMVHPYLDTDLVELLYGLSVDALTRGGRTKGLVRHSIAARFPDLGFEKQKKVDATSFFREHLQEGGASAWRSLGGLRALADLGVVDQEQLAPLRDNVFAGRQPEHHYSIWSALNLETWTRPRVARREL